MGSGSTQAGTRPLFDALVTLADLTDLADRPAAVDQRLTGIAWLAAQRVATADYASVTTLRGTAWTTVATTDALAQAVDEAQYTDGAGPCLEAFETGRPVAVPDTAAATMSWPGFHEVAPGLGLRASVSVPLFAGWGAPLAVLNLYGRDSAAMAPLTMGVAALYATGHELTLGMATPPVLDPGADELITGYATVLSIRATVRRAVELIADRAGTTADDAFTFLRLRAADGTSLSRTASAVLNDE